MKNQPKTASKSTCPSSCSVYIANLYFREGVKQIAFLSMEELEDFRAQHDKDFIIPQRIEAALKQLGTAWEYELEFARLAGVGLADLSAYRERYADYWLAVGRSGKRAWAGSKATAARMREMVR